MPSVRERARQLDPGRRVQVETAYSQALAYVWGRQDGDGSTEPRDTTLSERFAEAFAQAKLNFVTEQHFCMTNLQAAYESWTRDGQIKV